MMTKLSSQLAISDEEIVVVMATQRYLVSGLAAWRENEDLNKNFDTKM